MLYWFAKYWDEWNMSRWQVFLDSPMAGKVVQVYGRHHDLFDEDAKAVWADTPNPFKLPNLHVTAGADESMAINRIERGAIIIAGSGMANGGRILHHQTQPGPPRAHVVFVGYQGAAPSAGGWWMARSDPLHGRDFRSTRPCTPSVASPRTPISAACWTGSTTSIRSRNLRWCMARTRRARRSPARSANATASRWCWCGRA
jgi:metallo-beta-lactamase family protein